MPTRKICFNGFLVNTNSSILNLSLQHGFNIEYRSGNDAEKFITAITNIPPLEARIEITAWFPCLNMKEDRVYLISNSFDIGIDDETTIMDDKINSKIIKFEEEQIFEYLRPTINLLRLYKEGNIFMPFEFFYFYSNDIPTPLISTKIGRHFPQISIFNLENSEIKEVENFIQNTKLPFKEKPLQLAFDNFQMSYGTNELGIQFLLLMISMESLFSPGNTSEYTYRISRSSAVLIGKDKDDSKSVFDAMKKLYGKRSTILHSGNSYSITGDDLLKLRDFVRRSIKEFNKIGLDKKKILDILNSSGFGEKPWLQEA